MNITQRAYVWCHWINLKLFSTINKEYIDSEIFNQSDENAITDVEVMEKDITTTDEIRENLAQGPDGILAFFLKKTERTTAKLLMLKIRQSR